MGSELEKTESKSSFLKLFQEQYAEEFFPAEWDDKDKKRVQEITKPSRTKTAMYSSIPMSCQAEKCVFADTCPLLKEKLAPKGKACPLEMAMVVQFSDDYMTRLSVDENDLVEVSLVRNLVDYEVQYLRTSKYLAKESFIQENVIGIDANGEPVLAKALHLAVVMQDHLQKRQRELLKQLMASREAKAKAGMGQVDTAQAMANLMGEFRILQTKQQEVHLRKVGMEEYIEAEIVEEIDE